jgi:tetratricopeptide (TPR) repeat protein
MPVIPFYILIFVYGTRAVFQYLYSLISLKKLVNVTNITFLFIVLIFSVSESAEHKNLYAGQTKHIGIRQVTTARWLKDNTPENSVIAVHDVGAIGFYSGRKIIDVAGLINPEYILKLNEKNFSQLMIEDFKNNGVTHIAFLREWYQVTNQQPLFTTGDKNFELMEVYRFEPERTHILSREVNGMNNYALQMIQSKQIQQALSVLNRAYQIDPNSSLTTYYLAYALIVNGDKPNAEKFLKKALELNPDYREATLSLSDFYLREGKKQDAKLVAESFLKRNPSDTLVKSFMNKLGDTANTN